ncbi:hypothetical protein E4U60_000060 [Claviceps pazoutovae]|uniref:Uncharacterized protein n=1 Tax=Claviceps pazoutovae TaxID=1649127 RepID=A0A9P7MKF4_9HYPO|nr:hypothetical protein E4U60_000060 [Claviceps pazoutovae]
MEHKLGFSKVASHILEDTEEWRNEVTRRIRSGSSEKNAWTESISAEIGVVARYCEMVENNEAQSSYNMG